MWLRPKCSIACLVRSTRNDELRSQLRFWKHTWLRLETVFNFFSLAHNYIVTSFRTHVIDTPGRIYMYTYNSDLKLCANEYTSFCCDYVIMNLVPHTITKRSHNCAFRNRTNHTPGMHISCNLLWRDEFFYLVILLDYHNQPENMVFLTYCFTMQTFPKIHINYVIC